MGEISQAELDQLSFELNSLIGLKIDWLSIPERALGGFEPSQIAVIINTLLDAALPQIELLALDSRLAEKVKDIGIKKSPGLIGQRESYPDYIHRSGKRIELKGLFLDNPTLHLKRPPSAARAFGTP